MTPARDCRTQSAFTSFNSSSTSKVQVSWVLRRATVLLALVSFTGVVHAQIFSDSEARRALFDLSARLEQWQKDVNRRLDELQTRIDRLEGASRGQLELQRQIEATRQEMATLRGALEVQNNELVQTQRRQRDMAADVDARMKRFEPVMVNIDGKQASVEVAERRAYDSALAVFRSGDFRAAQTALQQFQAAYPQSPYGALVTYWLGSSQYAQKDNRGALSTLQGFVQKYPEHPRVPEAMLIIGTCQADLGDRKVAADTYRLLNQQYPESPAATSARERLAALGAASPPAPAPSPAAPAAPAPASNPSSTKPPTKR